jgi:uncharacterized protein DUF4157
MTTRMQMARKPEVAVAARPVPAGSAILRRKSAFEGSVGAGGECPECSQKPSQRDPRDAAQGTPPRLLPPTMHDFQRSPDRPLDAATRAAVEPRFGHDFSKLRVHHDHPAAGLALATRQPVVDAVPVSNAAVAGSGVLSAEPLQTPGPAPSQTPSPPPGQSPAQQPADQPTLISGTLNVRASPSVVTQKGGLSALIGARSVNWSYKTPLSVALTASIKDAPNSEGFIFGIVQNKTGGTWKAVYDDGPIVWNTPGPLLDVEGGQGDPQFILNNAIFPQAILGPTPQVTPSFTDAPQGETPVAERNHCNKQVKLLSFERSNIFRAGLVARGLQTKRLVQLGAIAGTYSTILKMSFSYTSNEWSHKFTDGTAGGSFALSPTAGPLTLSGQNANDEDTAGKLAAEAAYDQNCGGAAPVPPTPAPSTPQRPGNSISQAP